MAESRENNRQRLRRLRATIPGWSTAKNAKWQAKNPEKRRAHKTVENALISGRLVRQPCERCGTTRSVQAHHDDYARPLEVLWLCQLHHRERHRELDQMVSAAQGGSAPAHVSPPPKLTPTGTVPFQPVGVLLSAATSNASTPILQVTATEVSP